MPRKFAVPTYLSSKSKFGNELAVRKLNRIFKHYECIANAFVRPSNSAPSAVCGVYVQLCTTGSLWSCSVSVLCPNQSNQHRHHDIVTNFSSACFAILHPL